MSQKITTCLWFNGNLEEAVNFYLSVFKDGKITELARYPEGAPGPEGEVMTMTWTLFGQEFMGINAGPEFQFSEAISLSVDCKDQAEIDYLWERLTADGGEESMCGWLRDKYGLSWQIVPAELKSLFSDPDPERSQRAMQAMLQMRKLDINAMKAAADAAPVSS